MRYVVALASQATAETAQALVDLLSKLPVEGTDVGGGRHVTHAPAAPGPGWTSHWGEVRKHPDRAEWAIAIFDPDSVDLLHLDGAQVTLLRSRWTAAVELDASWFA